MGFAKNLMDNLKRREETVCKVAEYVLNFQKDLLVKDKPGIKSLTIKEVAKALNFHPSTISRAISNKYIQIGDKVVPLGTLLSHGIKRENGEVTSKTDVKHRIAAIIKKENNLSPLNDDEISEILKSEGIIVKRRTVAKYRQSLRILPVYLRKKARSVL